MSHDIQLVLYTQTKKKKKVLTASVESTSSNVASEMAPMVWAKERMSRTPGSFPSARMAGLQFRHLRSA